MILFLSEIWNESVNTTDRPLVKRDYAWASELGKSLIDRYLTMTAEQPTNPPNARARRKFFAGNVWEMIIGIVLNTMGIVKGGQDEVWCKDTPIPVKGKLDYLIGGKPDYNKAIDMIISYPFPHEIQSRLLKVVDLFREKYGDKEFDVLVHEVKSCSSFVIDKIMNGGDIPGHDLQIYHYLRGLKLPIGHIDYVSKDDALMATRVINNPNKEIEGKYFGDLTTLRSYLDSGQRPPQEPLILFEGKFTKNFNIEYSNYLTLVYGFQSPEHYRNEVSGKISSWNRVLKRIQDIENGVTTKTGKAITLTDKNKEAVDEMSKYGLNPYELSKTAQIESEEEE